MMINKTRKPIPPRIRGNFFLGEGLTLVGFGVD
jgi:hypothetical protein